MTRICLETIADTLRDANYLVVEPVVLTSAGRPCGADAEVNTGWLAKPFDAEHLLSAVDEQLTARVSRIAPGQLRDR